MRPPSHFLVPTDGSARARRAARVATELARQTHGRLTALYVMVERVPTAFRASAAYALSGVAPHDQPALERAARRALEAIASEAHMRGVRCACVRARAPQAWKKIIATARRRHCGMIVMGSHGRGAVAGAILGSETTQVLAHSKIPVLVCR